MSSRAGLRTNGATMSESASEVAHGAEASASLGRACYIVLRALLAERTRRSGGQD
jgi:hypothetical protein